MNIRRDYYITIKEKYNMNNFEKLMIILLNIFVLVTLISMVLTGNNWQSTGVHILCACSLGVNVLFAEYVICGGK